MLKPLLQLVTGLLIYSMIDKVIEWWLPISATDVAFQATLAVASGLTIGLMIDVKPLGKHKNRS